MNYITVLVILASVGIVSSAILWTIKIANAIPDKDFSPPEDIWKFPRSLL